MEPVYRITRVECHSRTVLVVGDILLGSTTILNNHIVSLRPKKVAGKDLKQVLDTAFRESITDMPLAFLEKLAQMKEEKRSFLDRLRGT